MYLLVTVISQPEKLKPILKKFKDLGITTSIAIDAVGTTNIDKSYGTYRPAIGSSLISISEVNHNHKLILSIVETEALVKICMDAVEKIAGRELKKPNTGITFSIPLIGTSPEDLLNPMDLDYFTKLG